MEIVKPLIIALDGRSGAGKTSLAHALSHSFTTKRVSVLHVEDLYRGWTSLAETSLLLIDLLEQLHRGEPVSWNAWDWANNTQGSTVLSMTPAEILIVEGVGSLHTALRGYLDLGIWLDANDGERKQRALKRDGETFAPHWQLWASQEQQYLDRHDPRQGADLVLDSDCSEPLLEQFWRLSRFFPAALQRFVPQRPLPHPRWETVQLPAPRDASHLFESLAAGSERAAFLESTSHQHGDPLGRNRYSIMALAQQPTALSLVSDSHECQVRSGSAILRLGTGFFAGLGKIWPAEDTAHRVLPSNGPQPQWVGYLGYELKREVGACDLSALLTDGSVRPDAHFFEPDTLLIIDHQSQTLSIQAPAHLMANTLERTRSLLLSARVSQPLVTPQFSCRDTPAGYQSKVTEAKEEIREGNTYEVCLTTELQASVADFSPFEAYCRLRVSSPAPFAHYLRLGSLEVASISPERFLSISASGKLRAEPIKGTRPRGVDEAEDIALRHDLATHPKDRAENIMIVDLLRNDLSHYAVPGSLSVPRLCAVETYTTVHQMVSTIDAQLRDPQLAAAALRETFPPGSMTGAPKLSTMNILDRLEDNRARGLYSGAVGYLGADGSADLAVVIRTLVCDQLRDGSWQLSLGLGGAITADSDPHDEWDEVRTKSRGVLNALGAEFPVTHQANE